MIEHIRYVGYDQELVDISLCDNSNCLIFLQFRLMVFTSWTRGELSAQTIPRVVVDVDRSLELKVKQLSKLHFDVCFTSLTICHETIFMCRNLKLRL